MRLSDKDFHYLCNVLRLGLEDSFAALGPDGRHFHCTIESVNADHIEVRVISRGGPDANAAQITLYQCLPKARKLDEVIRKCTEAGVAEVIPVESDHSVVRLSAEARASKLDRWRRVAREAVQQSGSPVPVQVHEPVAIDSVGRAEDGEALRLFLHQEPLEQQSLHGYLARSPRRIVVVVGPEGGLSARETQLLLEREFRPVYLGSQVLRTETAALYAVAAIRTILMERSSWMLN